MAAVGLVAAARIGGGQLFAPSIVEFEMRPIRSFGGWNLNRSGNYGNLRCQT